MVQKLLGKTKKKVIPPHRVSKQEGKQRKGRVAFKNTVERADEQQSRAVRGGATPRRAGAALDGIFGRELTDTRSPPLAGGNPPHQRAQRVGVRPQSHARRRLPRRGAAAWLQCAAAAALTSPARQLRPPPPVSKPGKSKPVPKTKLKLK